MTLVDSIRAIIADYMINLMTITLERIHSNGKETITIRHVSGATIELKDDGKVYINGAEYVASGGSFLKLDGTSTMTGDVDVGGNDVNDVNTLSGTDAANLTIEVGAGRGITFVERST